MGNDNFLNDLNRLDFMSFVTTDVNLSMNNIVNTLKNLADKHAPIKILCNAKRKQLRKPWICKAILTSIKNKHKLFKSLFQSGDPEKILKAI